MKITHFILAAVALTTPSLHANKTHSGRTKALTPEEQKASFTVPEGFIIELVASEKNGVINPIDLAFDDAGRLWTQTAQMYPLDPVADIKWNDLLKLMNDPAAQDKNPNFKRIKDLYQLKTKGQDKVLVLEDPTKRATGQLSVFADGMTIPQSILPYKNGVYVAHGSELFFLRDNDGDGKYDVKEEILTGFGFTDTHTMAHTLVRAPGDWIHFSQGALNRGKVTAVSSGANTKIDYSKTARFSLDGTKIEVVTAGLNNIWGFTLKGNGQWYGTEANDMSFSVTPMEPQTAFRGIGNQRIRAYQPFAPTLHNFRVGGTGISGLAFSEDGAKGFPAEWKNVALLANPINSNINAVRIIRNGDGTVTAKHLPDFLTSTDDWFRPVNIEFGPDGCLYVADWYNKIVSHNELPTTHPDRDKAHGRIWRIRHKSQVPNKAPNLTKLANTELIKHLSADILWQRRAAWHQIVDRQAKELAPALKALAANKKEAILTRIHALWSIEGLKAFDKEILSALIADSDPNIRREAIRSLASFDLKASEVAELVQEPLKDKNVMVRSQVLRTLAEIHKADDSTIDLLVSASLPASLSNTLGGGYERNFERYLARKAMEQYQAELVKYLEGQTATKQPAEKLLWALQALPQQTKEQKFLELWNRVKNNSIDEETFVAVCGMLNNKSVYHAVKPSFTAAKNVERIVRLSIKHQGRVQSRKLTKMLSASIVGLLSSKEKQTVTLALQASALLKITASADTASVMLEGEEDEALIALELAVLSLKPKAFPTQLLDLAKNEKLSLELRLKALRQLAISNTQDATHFASRLAQDKPLADQKVIASTLSSTIEGASVLKTLWKDHRFPTLAFDLSAAERTLRANIKDSRGRAILTAVQKRIAAEQKLISARIQKYITATKTLTGNPHKGKTVFQSCLMCHQVGTAGLDIAPALDGSANRELEGLLTAIVDPNAAIEGGYNLYRIIKKDGSSLEGYMYKKDAKGTTIAFMGGAKIFVEKNDIKSEHFVGGRSFMPDHFGKLPEQDMVDLISYIKTLKAPKVQQEDEAKAVSLFDGKTLKGWNPVVEKNRKYWSVVEGIITCSSGDKKMPTNTYLTTTEEYENFEFNCDFRLSGKTGTGLINSGIQYRSFIKKGKSQNKIVGYQADIGNDYWGDIYDEHRRGLLIKGGTKELMKGFVHDGWNSYTIRCQGDRHQLFINGKLTADWTEQNAQTPKKGLIALQLHSGGICKMEYKNIKVKVLK